MENRKLLFKENDRVKNISKSVFESDWTKEVITDGKELLIISEGVCKNSFYAKYQHL